MYDELRKEGRRDAQHCMAVKTDCRLGMGKEKHRGSKQNRTQEKTEKRTGPTLRSSKKKQQSMKSRNKLKQSPTKAKKKSAQTFFQLQAP